jgi:hypothetical protein
MRNLPCPRETARAFALDRKLNAMAAEIAARNVILAMLKVRLLLKYDPDENAQCLKFNRSRSWIPGNGQIRLA